MKDQNTDQQLFHVNSRYYLCKIKYAHAFYVLSLTIPSMFNLLLIFSNITTKLSGGVVPEACRRIAVRWSALLGVINFYLLKFAMYFR